MNNDITKKQLKFIEKIECCLNIKFSGQNKMDAINFIAENKERFDEEKVNVILKNMLINNECEQCVMYRKDCKKCLYQTITLEQCIKTVKSLMGDKLI